MKIIKKGDKVKVYHDPITKTNPEGIAKIKQIISKNLIVLDGIEKYEIHADVIFQGEEGAYFRTIIIDK